MKLLRNNLIFAFLFCLMVSLPVILPYFHMGYFPTHDGEWAVVRAGEMFREIRDLQFPPRFSTVLNSGYGYPLFNFAYPLPYYISVIFHFLGFGFVDSIKAIFLLTVPASAFFMFLLSSALFKNKYAGIVSTVLYVFLPYRFVDLYVRGSIGESLAFVLFPAGLFFILKIIEEEKPFYMIFTSFSLALLALGHNIQAVYFYILIVSFIIFYKLFNPNKNIVPVIISIILGFFLSAFFSIPALLEKSNISLSKIPIADRDLYFVNPMQLFVPSWGYGTPTESDPFTYQLGIPQLLILASSVFLISVNLLKKGMKVFGRIEVFLTLISLVFILMMLKPFSFVWKAPLLSEINYPWTLLLPIGFLTSLLAGYITSSAKGKILGLILCMGAIFLFFPYAHPQYYSYKNDDYYLTNQATTTSSDELMPLWVKEKPEPSVARAEIVKGAGKIENLSYNSKKISFTLSSENETIVRINTIYYPGWQAFINGTKTDIDYSNKNGLMEISAPKGNSNVVLSFGETRLRLFADFLSVASLLIIVLIAFKKKVA